MSFLSGSELAEAGTVSGGRTDRGTGALRVPLVDETALSDEKLRLRLGVLGRAESTLAAMKSRVLVELSRRHSKGDAQRLVRGELQASRRDAKRDVEVAARLAELPATSGALESGEIPVGHAQLIARVSGESPIDEELLVEAAGSEPFDEFAQTVKRHQRDMADDDGQALLDRQRTKRKARIFESADSGMFVLSGEFDQITGARIATALTAKERQLWHREDPNDRATPQQRMADALADLVCQPAGDGRSAGTDLLVIADFDVLKQQLGNPRLADGSPIPIVELHRLALEANLLPSIFDTTTQDMWLGRRLRTASEAQRIALIARDQHCIGCAANPLWCRAHHIVWWSKNGPTDLDNLALVCDDCHHKIHDHGWQVHKHPKTRKYYLKPPTHPPDKRPTGPYNKTTRNPSAKPSPQKSNEHPATTTDKPPTRPPGAFPTVSSEEPSTRPPNDRPFATPEQPPRNSPGKHPADPSNKPPTNSTDRSPTRPPSEHPANTTGKPLSGPSGGCPTVPSDEPAARQSGERLVVESDDTSRNSSDEVSTVSSGRPDRARTRADSAQPDTGNATQSTIQNAPRLAHGEQPQRKKQTTSITEQQQPAARTSSHEPVDGIDTS